MNHFDLNDYRTRPLGDTSGAEMGVEIETPKDHATRQALITALWMPLKVEIPRDPIVELIRERRVVVVTRLDLHSNDVRELFGMRTRLDPESNHVPLPPHFHRWRKGKKPAITALYCGPTDIQEPADARTSQTFWGMGSQHIPAWLEQSEDLLRTLKDLGASEAILQASQSVRDALIRSGGTPTRDAGLATERIGNLLHQAAASIEADDRRGKALNAVRQPVAATVQGAHGPTLVRRQQRGEMVMFTNEDDVVHGRLPDENPSGIGPSLWAYSPNL